MQVVPINPPNMLRNDYESMSHLLNLDEYGFWLDAILEDNDVVVDQTLSNCSEKEKYKLFFGTFNFEESELKKDPKDAKLIAFPAAICMAFAMNAQKVVKTFLRHGLDTQKRNKRGNNLIHLLAYISDTNPDCAKDMLEMYDILQANIPSEDLRDMLLSEGNSGLRPLEYAYSVDLADLALNMTQSRGTYLAKEVCHGATTTYYFDITDYEVCRGRAWTSPLFFLATFDPTKLSDETFRRITSQSTIVQQWIDAKMKGAIPFLVIWAFMRGFFFTMFYRADKMLLQKEETILKSGWTNMNNTSTNAMNLSCIEGVSQLDESLYPSGYGFVAYTMTYAICALTWHLYDFVAAWRMSPFHLKYFREKKNMVINFPFFRYVQILLYTLVLVNLTVRIIRIEMDITISVHFDNFCYFYLSFTYIWSMLQFVQLLPVLGPFTYALQHMLQIVGGFMAIFFAIDILISTTLSRIINDGKMKCVEPYSDFGISLYSTFLILINMLDFRELDVKDEISMYVIHTLFVFMITILVINFLIAFLSATVNYVEKNRAIILNLQRLSMAIFVEFRLCYLIPQFESIYRRFLSRQFLIENGRYYLTETEMGNLKSL